MYSFNTSVERSLQSLIMKWSSFIFLLSTATATESSEPQPRQTSLQWTECSLDAITAIIPPDSPPVECANLSVPLDYTEELSTEQISLQLVKVRATQQPSKGSLLINPGGPGISALNDAIANHAIYNRSVHVNSLYWPSDD